MCCGEEEKVYNVHIFFSCILNSHLDESQAVLDEQGGRACSAIGTFCGSTMGVPWLLKG